MEEKPTYPSMRRTNMYFTHPQMEKLTALSIETGLSAAELVRRAVDEYLARQANRASSRAKTDTIQRAKPEARKPGFA